MDKQIVIVTGATKGIGLEIARTLSENDYFVIGTYVSDYDFTFLSSLENDNFILKQVDSSDYEKTQDFAKEIRKEYGSITHLVNNAGIVKDNLLMMMKEEEFDAVINVNLKGAFNLTKAFTRQLLRSKNGSIVNIASVIGITGNMGQSNYAASKAGLIGFSKSLAKEFASRNLRVNAIAPGFIKTDMTDQLDEDTKTAILDKIALNKFGEAKDIANAVKFLISEDAKYITGQTLNVCGGMII